MAYTAETQTAFATSLTQFIQAYNAANGTNYDVRNGTTLQDIVINAPASQYAVVSTDLQTVSRTQSVNYATTMSQADLIDLASNYGLVLGIATFSTGSAYFVTYTEPSFDIIINAGTIISTPTTSTKPAQQYQTTETVVMYASNPAIYQFTDSQLNIGWRIASTIQAQVAGAAGNTASNTITSLNQSVSGITSVYNDLPTLGGTDIETNQSLGERIQAKLTGNNVGTSTGVKSLVLTNPLVEDVSVVGPNDPEMQRNQYGGSVDVYILGNNNIGIVEQQIYSSLVGYLEIAHTPAHSVSIVSGIVSGLPHTFTLGVEAVFVKDVGLFAGSISEDSRITFPTLVKPDDGTQVSITLTYDSLIPTLQNLINLPENNILASDILLRECIDVVVDVYAELVLFSGYTPSVVAAAVKTAVTTYLDSTKLGISVISSELVSIITGIDGVDSVKLSTFIPENDIAIGKNQVSVAGTIALKIGNTIY